MKINPVLSVARVLLFFVALFAGVCFAQSDSAIVPEGRATVVAQLDPRMVDLVADSAESGSAEVPAESRQKAAVRPAYSRIGIGVKVSTLGAGLEVATPLGRKFNLRGGLNLFRYSRPITNDGIHYQGQLKFQSGEAHLDWFPFGGFHVSPGVLFYNGNELTATAMVPGGQTFSEGGAT